ncbi:ABC transporter substrate-binding protein [Streptosporangium sp. NPDC004631]
MKTQSGPRSGSRRRHAVAGVLAAAAMAMTACGGSTSGGAPKPSGGEIPEFVFATQGTIGSLDLTKDFGAFGPVALINEQLEHSHSDGGFAPGLAAEVSETPKSLVYRLRPDAKFTDGKPVTAADVVFSIERARAAGAQTASYLTSVVKAEATGDNQVTVTLSRPDPALRALFAGAVAVVQKAYVEAHPENYGSSSALPVGSGPYSVGSFTPEQIVLNRNDRYWGEKPKIRQLTIRLLKDDDTTQLAMRSGDVDSTILIDVGNARRYQSIEGTTLIPITGNSISYLSLDTGQAPLSDQHVRKAIAYAIDRKPLFDTLFAGYWKNLEGFMTPDQLASVSSPSEAADFLKGLPQYPFDMERAKSELARSRYPEGFDLTVKVSPTFAWSEKLMLSLKQNLKPLGIDIEVKVVDPKAYVAEVYAHRNLGVKPLELGALTPDAAYILKLLVGSSTAVQNGLNTANFASADIDAAIAVLTSSPDRAKRFEAAKRLLGWIAEQVPYIPLFNQQTVRVMGRGFAYDAAVADQNDYANGSWIYKISATS